MAPPRPDLGLKYEMLLAAQAVLGAAMPAADDAQWLAHDALARAAGAAGLPLPRAAQVLGQAVPLVSWCLQMAAQLEHWDDGGADGHDALVAWLDEAAADDDRLMPLALLGAALLPLAQAHTLGHPMPAMADCAECGDTWWQLSEAEHDAGHAPSALDCALIAAALLRRARHGTAPAAGRWALQLLHAQPRQAVLSRRPRIKYPPWPVPDLAPAVVRALAHGALQAVFFGGPPAGMADAALDTALRGMVADADEVITLPLSGVRVPDGDGWRALPDLRVEVRFGQPLLLRLQAASMAGRASAPSVARALVGCWLAHGEDLTHWRDGHLHDWWHTDGRRPRDDAGVFASAVACVQTIGGRMLVVLGEAPDDIDRWQIHGRHAQAARDHLRRARDASAQR
jgi:hypothetical protein